MTWLPSIAVTGATSYTGDRFRHWKRNLFVGGLREGGVPGTGQVQRIIFNERWQELRESRCWWILSHELATYAKGRTVCSTSSRPKRMEPFSESNPGSVHPETFSLQGNPQKSRVD